MNFHDKYTKAKNVSKEADFLKTLDAKQLDSYSKQVKFLEKDKEVLSNDAFALGEMLELLINTWRNK